MISCRPVANVLVPAYNAGRYLAEFCRSVQAQSFLDFEVIFAIDGPTDEFCGFSRQVSLVQELCRHGVGMVKTQVPEKVAMRTRRFQVSGLAQINDPIFR
jgi:hypothetical protein